jgi:hypothetical protein
MIKDTILGLILLIALYLGTGGFIILQNEQLYEKSFTLEAKEVIESGSGIKFANKERMEAALQQALIQKIYPYAKSIPSALSFVLTAISFGIIGSIGKIINDVIIKKQILNEVGNLLLIPLQGGIIGLIILGVSYAIPVLLTSDAESLKPITVVFLSLFGGIFYLQFYKWFSKAIDKVVSKDS